MFYTNKKTFIEHLKLLRIICIGVIICFCIIFCLCFFFLKPYLIIYFTKYIKILHIHQIIYFSVYDGFFLPLILAFFLSLYVSFLLLLISLSVILEILSYNILFLITWHIYLYIIFIYIIPMLWKYFFVIEPICGLYMANIHDILLFILQTITCCCIVLYTPIIIYILYFLKIFSFRIINIIRQYWIFISIVIGGIFAPADVLSHIIMSFCMICIFEILFFFCKKHDRRIVK
jgi:sec-independent protein translocase protein TatC